MTREFLSPRTANTTVGGPPEGHSTNLDANPPCALRVAGSTSIVRGLAALRDGRDGPNRGSTTTADLASDAIDMNDARTPSAATLPRRGRRGGSTRGPFRRPAGKQHTVMSTSLQLTRHGKTLLAAYRLRETKFKPIFEDKAAPQPLNAALWNPGAVRLYILGGQYYVADVPSPAECPRWR